jgi:predicted CoA-binding protein
MADIPEAIDMIDVFRAPEYLGEVVQETLSLPVRPKVIWGQLTVRDDEAVKPAEAVGIKVVMDRCPAIEIPRLGL